MMQSDSFVICSGTFLVVTSGVRVWSFGRMTSDGIKLAALNKNSGENGRRLPLIYFALTKNIDFLFIQCNSVNVRLARVQHSRSECAFYICYYLRHSPLFFKQLSIWLKFNANSRRPVIGRLSSDF